MVEATSISDFLAENVAPAQETKEIKFKRFKSPFKVRSLTGEDVNRLRREATKRVLNRKTHQYENETDQNEFISKIVVESVVVPDLLNEKLQRSYGVIGDPEKLLGAMLSAGEYSVLANEVTELSHLDGDMNALVDEAKN